MTTPAPGLAVQAGPPVGVGHERRVHLVRVRGGRADPDEPEGVGTLPAAAPFHGRRVPKLPAVHQYPQDVCRNDYATGRV